MIQINKDVIGRVEKISFPKLGSVKIAAKVDTGAETSSIWATKINLDDDGTLSFCLFGVGNPNFSGQKITTRDFRETIVVSSIGNAQHRYKVKLAVKVKKRLIRASFTLSDRSRQVYPVLIGRNILRGKFIVDVNNGSPLIKLEKAYSNKLQAPLQSRVQKD